MKNKIPSSIGYYKRAKIPLFELELMLAHVLHKSREYILTHPEIKLTLAQKSKINSFIMRRKKGEPLAYILGHKEFYALDFIVNKNVLIPRPETEMMVDEVLSLVHSHGKLTTQRKFTIIDVGTGSGCIIITLAKLLKNKFPKARIKFFATDISRPALALARKNAKLNNMSRRVKFNHGNLLEPLFKSKTSLSIAPRTELQKSKFIITANLPYLTAKQIKESPSIKYEPRLALEAGKDGLKYYRELFREIKSIFTRNSALSHAPVQVLCEIDPSQKLSIRRLSKHALPQAQIQIKKDLRGHSRLVNIKL